MQNRRSLIAVLIAEVLALLAGVNVSAAEERSDFTVVVLPDTQFYSQSYPETYISQTQWIKDRREADNIKFVVHLGDIVQNYNHSEEEWKAADRAHRILDGVVPYSVVPGNHDMEYVDKKLLRDTRLYNKYFPPARFEKYPWYGGHMGDTNDSNYCFFEAAGMKFMVLSLEYAPRDETLEWADRIVASHPEHRVHRRHALLHATQRTRYRMWNGLRPGGQFRPGYLGEIRPQAREHLHGHQRSRARRGNADQHERRRAARPRNAGRLPGPPQRRRRLVANASFRPGREQDLRHGLLSRAGQIQHRPETHLHARLSNLAGEGSRNSPHACQIKFCSSALMRSPTSENAGPQTEDTFRPRPKSAIASDRDQKSLRGDRFNGIQMALASARLVILLVATHNDHASQSI